MKKLILSISLSLLLGLVCFSQTKPKNIALLLGSASLPTLVNRVNVLLDLYHIKKIDKIIVSGGCGAHASSICEATEMKNRLVAKGVPENIIYKEENSKTTVQNYIFSRVLRDKSGQQIIQKNDSLFVVSDHWHAIAVAARFNKYDHVYTKFFIEGDLVPKPTDLLDYGDIFNKTVDNNEFISKGTWPTPDAVYHWNGFTNYIFLDRIYSSENSNPSNVAIHRTSEVLPALPKNWELVDAVANDSKQNALILFYKEACQIYFEKASKAPLNLSLTDLILNLPSDVKYVDACFIKDNDIYLFNKSRVIVAKRIGNKFKVFKIEEIKNMIGNWPYAWGSGDLSAANYNAQEKAIYLYKNGQFLKFNERNNSVTRPEKPAIKWQNIN